MNRNQLVLALAIILLAVTHPTMSATPIAWWPGDGNTNDAVGSNHGTLQNGATFSSGHVGQAFSFDGINDYVSFGNSIGNFGSGDFTVEFWVRTPTARTQAVLGKRPVCGATPMWEIRGIGPSGTNAGQITMAVSQSSSVIGHIRIIGDEWTDGDFHHMAYTRQGATLRGYRDGIKVYEVIAAIANMANTELLRAGRSPCIGVDGTFYFTGELDEIKLYDFALSDSEVAEAAATTIPVDIDIKPGSDPNSINLCSQGSVPVAILGTDDYDVLDFVTGVDPDTITLADASVRTVGKGNKLMCHEDDVNSDGLWDLVCQIPTVDLAVELGVTDTSADLNAQTYDGASVAGSDSIRIVKDCN